MEFIHQNPFRILGLPVTATDREISKRVNDLSTFAEFGKSVSYDSDLTFLSPVARTPEAIEKAAQRIELSDRKLHYANFWFWIENSVDQLAMELLGEGSVEKALELWARKSESEVVCARNISNHKNHALLSFMTGNRSDLFESRIDPSKLGAFIRRSVGVMTHPAYERHALQIAGKTYRLEPERQIIAFSDELSKAIPEDGDGANGASLKSEFIGAFEETSTGVQWHVMQKYTAQPMRRIERLVEEAGQARELNPDKAYEVAIGLADSCEGEIEFLKGLLPSGNPQLQNLSDKVAEELITCGTAYFNKIQNDDRERAIKHSKELTMRASAFALGPRTKKRIDDDLSLLETFAQEERLSNDTNRIITAIEALPQLDAPFLDASLLAGSVERLLQTTRAPLLQLSRAGQDGKQAYQVFGNILANLALAMCVRYVNETGDLARVSNLMPKIANLPMDAETRQRFDTNSRILAKNLTVMASAGKGSGPCYIATLVYGGYEQYQVVALRTFRDRVLLENSFGRLFVRFYYRVSPTLVKWLQPYPSVQKSIRCLLDCLVRKVS